MGAWDTLAREREEAVEIGARALRERDELRAELDTVRGALATEMRFHDQARAEVEQHERRFRETEAEWVERFEALEAEIERLKVLLREHGIEDVQSLPRTEAQH